MSLPTSPTPGSSEPGSPEDRLSGRLLVGRYRLNRAIASGGMAQVWEATDETLARRVAVKLLHLHLVEDDSFVQRFRNEAVAAARLAHPSIVSVYDTFSTDGLEAIVMELVQGTTMRADLDDHGPMRLEAVLAIGSQVADALGTAHASGLVHRDVKPANILLSTDGRVLVADFGIAKAAEGSDLTSAGAMIGTAKYLAPEQVEGGPIDGRADLYSLGVVLYEALTGVPPFQADTDTAMALARLTRDPRPPRELRPDIPPDVAAVVMQALARRREDRFATAAAMRTALLAAGADPSRARAVATRAASTATPSPPMAAVSSPPPPPPPAPAPAPARPTPAPAPAAPTEPAPMKTGRLLAVLAGIVALAVIVAVVLVGVGDTGGSAGDVQIRGASSFDPQGDNGTERDDLVPNAIDGDRSTAWESERYQNPPDLFGKDGVGLALELDGQTQVDQVDVVSPEGGWSAQVYVASGSDLTDLAAWGEPVASVSDAATGTTRFDVDATGDRVLVWFTASPPSGIIKVSEVEVGGS